MLQVVLLENSGRSLQLQKVQENREANAIVQRTIVDIILQEYYNKRLGSRSETQEYENTYSEINEKDLYELDKLILDDSNKD